MPAGNHDNPLSQAHYQRHRQRLMALDLAGHLLEAVRLAQNHRAASMAILAGDGFFEYRRTQLQEGLEKQLKITRLYTQSLPEAVRSDEWRTLLLEWATVTKRWRNDSVLENFALHTHLIAHLIQQMDAVIERSGNAEADRYGSSQLANLLCKDIARIAELIGQLRGLGTHALVLTHDAHHIKQRMEFIGNEVQQSLEQVQAAYAALPATPLQVLSKVEYREQPFSRTRDLLELLRSSILPLDFAASEHINTDTYYAAATRVVDGYFYMTKAGLRVLRAHIDDAMRYWIEQGGFY